MGKTSSKIRANPQASLYSIQERINITQIKGEETQNNTEFSNRTEIEYQEEDPFKNYSFANVIHLDDSNYTTEIKKYEKFNIKVYWLRWKNNEI